MAYGVVRTYSSIYRRGMAVVDGLAGEVMIDATKHVSIENALVCSFSPPPIPVEPGIRIEVPIVIVSRNGNYQYAALWRCREPLADVPPRQRFEDLASRLVPAQLKFYREEKRFGFVVVDGVDHFAHVSAFRFVEAEGYLRAPERDEAIGVLLQSDPKILCLPGTGQEGKKAALVWLIDPS